MSTIEEFPIQTVHLNDASSSRLDGKADESTVVHKSGNETIAGTKTFSSPVVVPEATANGHAVNKEFLEKRALLGYVMESDGVSSQSLVAYDFFPMDVPLDDCFYERWLCGLLPSLISRYDGSGGSGGAHGMLAGPANGNFVRGHVISSATNATPIVITTETAHDLITGQPLTYIRGVVGNTAANGAGQVITVLSPTTFSIDGSAGNGAYVSGGLVVGPLGSGGRGMVEFNADDVPYENQWAHHGIMCDETNLGAAIMTYDGIPVGMKEYTGRRVCPNIAGNPSDFFIFGSDHNGVKARISQYRVFEGGKNPKQASYLSPATILSAFTPASSFANASPSRADGSAVRSSLLLDFSVPERIVTDKSSGWPEGRTHSPHIRGTGNNNLVGNPNGENSTYPGLRFVVDPTAPNAINGLQPVQPDGRVYTPVAAGVGDLVFDSIERKNSTKAFDNLGGIGSTESGSLGPKVWRYHSYYTAEKVKPFGVLNEQFVVLTDGGPAIAWVDIPNPALDIRVSRKANSNAGAGIATGLCFRVVDEINYLFAVTCGVSNTFGTRINQVILLGKVVAGVTTALTGNTTACPATNWEVLRVVDEVDGSFEVFCDATSVYAGSEAAHAGLSEGAGIAIHGNPSYYGWGHTGAALRMRYRNFRVRAA